MNILTLIGQWHFCIGNLTVCTNTLHSRPAASVIDARCNSCQYCEVYLFSSLFINYWHSRVYFLMLFSFVCYKHEFFLCAFLVTSSQPLTQILVTNTDCSFYNNVTFVIFSGILRLREQQHSFGVSWWAWERLFSGTGCPYWILD
jgi:hypothetical protein